MTLHLHKVDDCTSPLMHNINGPMPSGVIGDYVEWDSSEQPLNVPAGWQIVDGDADDIRVCGAHPWQSWWLVFANGDSYGTAMCNMSSCIGACALEHIRKMFASHLALGQKFGLIRNGLKKDAELLRAKFDHCDVLLRRQLA